ncbi:unnamed protein product [Mytilus edulis]|uniref:Uncharacterized protein n=1 Tax=Mytilus edulis TaxID=6550 RepID=A0A8S3QLM8_MYTED|nr:unnamed protein product [Mytilus edulis]
MTFLKVKLLADNTQELLEPVLILNETGTTTDTHVARNGVYDEVDENPSRFNTADLNVTSEEPHYETVDLVSLERPSTTTNVEHGDTGYLDPCFAMEDDQIHRLKDQTSQEECCSTTSSISDVVDKDNTAYNNPYQPLQENWQDGSHGYEVPVIVYKCIEHSARVDEKSTSIHTIMCTNRCRKTWI